MFFFLFFLVFGLYAPNILTNGYGENGWTRLPMATEATRGVRRSVGRGVIGSHVSSAGDWANVVCYKGGIA